MKPYEVKNNRNAEHEINKIFTNRWSPRSLSYEGFTEKNLLTLFEAARWAPSSSNGQPWRFLYAMHGTQEWEKFYELLNDFNKMWCKNAGALIVLLSKEKFDDGKLNLHYSFDSGSAWMSLALQARMLNLIAHGMAGFDAVKARTALKVPEGYKVEVMIAVGRQGKIENLHERMQKSEKPNERKKVSEFASEGMFPEKWKLNYNERPK